MPCGRHTPVLGLLLLFAASAAHSQIRQNPPVDVLGQVYAPSGGPVTRSVRINFSDDGGFRPPEIIYSDSNGRFVIYRLAQGQDYTVMVDEEEGSWGQTIVRFQAMGRRPTVQVYLAPYSKPKLTNQSPSVSAAALRGGVPGKARHEFEEGMQSAIKGDTAKARKRFEKAVALHPEFVEARNELAVVLMKDGNLAGAEAELRRAIEVDSTAALPLMNLGLCIYRQQRYAEAAGPLERAVQLQPENYRAHLLLGMVWVVAGDDPRAEATLLRAYELGGARASRAQYYLSHFYTRKKAYPKAARALETYLHDSPSDPAAAELQKTLERLRASLARN